MIGWAGKVISFAGADMEAQESTLWAERDARFSRICASGCDIGAFLVSCIAAMSIDDPSIT